MSESEISEENRCEQDEYEPEYEVIVVPWRTADQFKKVYEYLFSPEIIKKKWALDQISVWEERCYPSLPSAIEASYGLTSAIVQDILWTNSASVNQQIDIQYLYSSAITRFVNLTVDIQTNKQGNMSTIAKGLGIPTFIIDLRNEACHSQRPSLACLRIAADAAMKYLKKSYWDIEVKQVQNYIQGPIDVSDIEALLNKYIFNTFKVLQMEQENNEVDQKYISIYLYKELGKCIKKDKRLFINTLVGKDFFIPNDEVFHKYLTDSENELFKSEEDPDSYITPNDTSTIPIKIPALHEKLWLTVIKLLNKNDAVPLFLETLLKTQGDRTVMGQKLLISWVLSILRIHSVGAHYVQTEIKKVFKKRGCLINWHSMFYAAVANPCKYTPYLLPLILCNLDLKRGLTKRILNLVAIILGQVKDDTFQPYKSITGAPRIFTLDQLKRDKHLQNVKKRKINDDSECIWSLVTDDSYKNWPIGHVLNPVIEENIQAEEDIIDLDVNDDIQQKFIFSNESDEEQDENTTMITDEIPNTLEERALEAIKKRKSFLYKK